MNDKSDELRRTLEKLHQQLEGAHDLESSLRAELATTIDEIDDALEREGGDHAGPLDRLRESARHFEQSHPGLSEAVARLSDLLSRIGV